MNRQSFLLPALAVWILCSSAIADAALVQATLNWIDNSANESGFLVERSSDGTNFDTIAVLGENVVSYTDTAVEMGVLYFYRVCAFNAAGKSQYTPIVAFEVPQFVSYSQWLGRYLDVVDLASAILQPEATPTFPDLTNLVCYVYGLNPFNPDRSLLPKTLFSFQDGQVVPKIQRVMSRTAAGVTTSLLVSSDMVHWTNYDFKAEVVSQTADQRWEVITLPALDGPVFFKFQFQLDTSSF